MSRRTRQIAEAELEDFAGILLGDPTPEWTEVRRQIKRVVDALHEHMEDEFMESATPTSEGEDGS